MFKNVMSKQFKSITDKSKTDYGVIASYNAPVIDVETAKIIFCKGGDYPTQVTVRTGSENTIILRGSWTISGCTVSGKETNFTYTIPKEDNVNWDEQIHIVKTKMAEAKEVKEVQTSSEIIQKAKDALNIVSEIKTRKRQKGL